MMSERLTRPGLRNGAQCSADQGNPRLYLLEFAEHCLRWMASASASASGRGGEEHCAVTEEEDETPIRGNMAGARLRLRRLMWSQD